MAKALLLFSGGLDSILAAKLLEKQGIEITCVHFTTPFFGAPEMIPSWKEKYDLNVICKDIDSRFIKMLINYPEHGYGKNLNPCIDCKILIFSEAKKMMIEKGADFLCSGEVLGQRPMSQRKDTLNLIQNKADVAGLLLRPLCARLLQPTLAEEKGLVNRSELLGISGRGRNPQLELAQKFGLSDIPSPAGGCRLTEKENARRYWQLLKLAPMRQISDLEKDFKIIANGRAIFHMKSGNWMIIGRNRANNQIIAKLAGEQDILLRLQDFPGPLALARNGANWSGQRLKEAAEIVASYAPAAVHGGFSVNVIGKAGKISRLFNVLPRRNEIDWHLPEWEQTHTELKQLRKSKLLEKGKNKGLLP